MKITMPLVAVMVFLALSASGIAVDPTVIGRVAGGDYSSVRESQVGLSALPQILEQGWATISSSTATASASSSTTSIAPVAATTGAATGVPQYITFDLKRELAMLLVNNNLGDRKFGALFESPEQEALPTIIMRLRSDLDPILTEASAYCQSPEQYVSFLDGKGWRASRIVVDVNTHHPIGFVALSAYNRMPNGDTDHYVVTAWSTKSGKPFLVFDDQIWLCFNRDNGQYYTEHSRPWNSIADSTRMYGI